MAVLPISSSIAVPRSGCRSTRATGTATNRTGNSKWIDSHFVEAQSMEKPRQ